MLYDELIRKSLSEKSFWLHIHRICVENLSRQVVFLQFIFLQAVDKLMHQSCVRKFCESYIQNSDLVSRLEKN